MKAKTSRQLSPRRFFYDLNGVVIGYGCEELHLETISAWLARTVITRYHYSHKAVNNSYLHLGVFAGRELVGVLQFGYAMNPNSGRNIVIGTGNREYMELNRMWIHDSQPRNTESRAISYAFRIIRSLHPSVRWVQSFADERCGAAGAVYQAANFLFIGSHFCGFYELDGVLYHELTMNCTKRGGASTLLRANRQRAVRRTFRQYRYIYFLDKRAKGQLNEKRFKVMDYPKPAD